MNYRHAFHAGNFADIVKHAVLTLVLQRMRAKPTRMPARRATISPPMRRCAPAKRAMASFG